MIAFPRSHHLRRTVLGVSALALVLGGCGSDGTEPSGGASGPESTAGATDTGSDAGSDVDAEEALSTAYSGVLGEPPSTPTVPVADQSVWVVSCGQQLSTCSTPSAAAVAAAEAVGWTAQICDGQLNPEGWSACIRQGISAKSTVIIQVGQDCSSFRAALQEATAADITTIGLGGNDCDVDGGEKEFTATTQKLGELSSEEWWNKMGALQADWIIGETGGTAQVLSLKFTDALFGTWLQEGFEAELESCSGCAVVSTLEIANQDVGGGTLPTKFSTALLQNPDVNAINVPLDGWFLAGLAQAVQSSGRSDDLAVIGAFGELGNLDLIRSGTGQDASVGFSADWDGWAAIDTTIRVLNGEPVESEGVGLQVIDAENNMPAEGDMFAYEPVVDYVAAFEEAWGVG